MVINGITIQEDDFKIVTLERERVRLPPRFVEEAGLTGTKSMECALFVVTAGRYRLVARNADLSEMLKLIQDPDAGADVFSTDSNERAAMGSRLIPCVASPHGRGWRINVPKEAIYLAPGDRSHVFLIIVQGFVELWFPDTLRQAVSTPISEVLS